MQPNRDWRSLGLSNIPYLKGPEDIGNPAYALLPRELFTELSASYAPMGIQPVAWKRQATSGMRLGRARGFTLIELIVVLVLLGVIAAVAIPRFVDLTGAGKRNVTRERMNNIRRAIMGDPTVVVGGRFSFAGFRGDLNQLPDPLAQLATQGALPAWNAFSRRGWNGPYIDAGQLSDGWGNPISIGGFDADGVNGRTFTLRSAGPDGVAGDADDILLTVNF